MKRQALLIVVLVLIGSMLGSYFTYTWYIQKTNPVQAEPTKNPTTVPTLSDSRDTVIGSDAIVKAVEKISPSVVFITTRAVIERDRSGMFFPNIPEEFKNHFFFFDPYEEFQFGPKERTGSGSGIIISNDGLILTNQHVIENATNIKVKINLSADGSDKQSKIFDATVKGADKLNDVAIIKIDAKNLPAAMLGDSDKMKVGEWVIAVGNPLGYEHTVTVGVLSAKGRRIPFMDREYPNLLQTDAAINPGNSGGPLANLKGEVIGMNTIISVSGQGLGFAIPINSIKRIKEDLITKGKVTRSFIGIQMMPMDESKATYLGMPKVEGVLVARVFDGTPAAQAGLKPGDVILEINGTKVNSTEELQTKIREMKVGQSLTLKIWRDKNFKNISLKVAEMPNPEELQRRSR